MGILTLEVSLTKAILEEIRRIDLEFYPHIGPINACQAMFRCLFRNNQYQWHGTM